MGTKTILVPYRPHHIIRYHEWMKSPFLLDMTGSEPLSIEEEIKMQESWKNDDEKCTFIVLAKSACSCTDVIQNIEEDAGNDDDEITCKNAGATETKTGTETDTYLNYDFVVGTLDAMVGDVNLFLSDIEDDSGEDDDSQGENQEHTSIPKEALGRQAELDVMIAEENYRRMGIGKEATLLMMLYGAKNLEIRKFVVKIKEDNLASRKLFDNLGFQECNYAACFKEYELEYTRPSPEEMVKSIQDIYKTRMFKWKSPEQIKISK